MPPTNIDLDDDLVDRAMRASRIGKKRDLVHAGLKALIRMHEQREIRDLRGRLQWEDAEPAPAGKGRR